MHHGGASCQRWFPLACETSSFPPDVRVTRLVGVDLEGLAAGPAGGGERTAVKQRRSRVPPVAVGGTLLAALRHDGRYGLWTLRGAAPEVVVPLVEVAAAHQVLPIVRDALIAAQVLGTARGRTGAGVQPERDAPGGSVPALEPAQAEIAVELARVTRQVESAVVGAVAQHLRVCAELAQIVPLLDDLNVAWAIVKGPALAALAYPRPELRPYGDIDVLVGPQDFGAVVAALEDAGAVLLDRNWSYLEANGRCEVSMRLRHGTYLDLHWHLVNNAHARGAFRLDTDALLERRRVLDIGGRAISTLDATDTLLHVALHATFSGGHRLSWVKDVERLVAVSDLDWDAVVRRSLASRTGPAVGVLLQRARRLLDAPVPTEVLAALAHPRAEALGLRAVERLATPSSLVGTHHTGQLLLLTARADTRSSARALLTELRRKAHGRFGTAGQKPESASTDPDRDPAARRRYLDHLADHGEAKGAEPERPRRTAASATGPRWRS